MRSPKSLSSLVAIAAAVLLLVPTLLSAEVLPRPLQERIVLETHGGALHGVLPGCPPCAGLSVVVNAHNYSGAVALYDSATGELVGEIQESRHAHLTCAESGQRPDLDTCFQKGVDVLPNTTLDMTIALKGDERGVGAYVNLHATGPTKVTRLGDGDEKTVTSMELNDTILYGETDAGIPVAIRIGRSFGLEPTKGTAQRVSTGPFPDYVTMVVQAHAQLTIGWPEEVSLEVSPQEEGSTEVAVNVLSNDEFDAFGQIDREHLTFGPTGTEMVLNTCVREDVNGDGRGDLKCELDGQLDERGLHDVVVRGFTANGDPFEGRTSFSHGTRVATVQE